jgi:outer membrane protein TolC
MKLSLHSAARKLDRFKRSSLTSAFCLLLSTAISSGNGLTLDVALRRTIDDNPEIQQARIELERAAGARLIFRSVALPDAYIGVAGGAQGGHRAGQDPIQGFGFAYGDFTQPFFNMAIPPSLRRGDIEVLIAQQNLNVAVTRQLHAARLAFYSAVYNRDLGGLRARQRDRLAENTRAQKTRYETGLTDRAAFVAANLQERELDPRVDLAQREYEGAILKLSEALGKDFAQYATLPQVEGELHYADVDVDLARAQMQHRPDIELARLMVRAAAEDQRIMEAAYWPQITGAVSGRYIPVTAVRETQATGSASRADDIISSEIRAGGAYTWRVIDNGKVGGAVAQKRAAREINEIMLQKLQRDAERDVARIRNDLDSIATKHKALQAASAAADENAKAIEQNLARGISSQYEYRLAENDLLEVQTALLTLAYQQHVDLAEWDRATGKYLRFMDGNARDVR